MWHTERALRHFALQPCCALLYNPPPPTQELLQGPSSAMNLLTGLVSPVLQALNPSRHVRPERSLSYTPTPDSPPRRSKRTSQPPEHSSVVQEAEKQARDASRRTPGLIPNLVLKFSKGTEWCNCIPRMAAQQHNQKNLIWPSQK